MGRSPSVIYKRLWRTIDENLGEILSVQFDIAPMPPFLTLSLRSE